MVGSIFSIGVNKGTLDAPKTLFTDKCSCVHFITEASRTLASGVMLGH